MTIERRRKKRKKRRRRRRRRRKKEKEKRKKNEKKRGLGMNIVDFLDYAGEPERFKGGVEHKSIAENSDLEVLKDTRQMLGPVQDLDQLLCVQSHPPARWKVVSRSIRVVFTVRVTRGRAPSRSSSGSCLVPSDVAGIVAATLVGAAAIIVVFIGIASTTVWPAQVLGLRALSAAKAAVTTAAAASSTATAHPRGMAIGLISGMENDPRGGHRAAAGRQHQTAVTCNFHNDALLAIEPGQVIDRLLEVRQIGADAVPRGGIKTLVLGVQEPRLGDLTECYFHVERGNCILVIVSSRLAGYLQHFLAIDLQKKKKKKKKNDEWKKKKKKKKKKKNGKKKVKLTRKKKKKKKGKK
jgi:hypothetical protein